MNILRYLCDTCQHYFHVQYLTISTLREARYVVEHGLKVQSNKTVKVGNSRSSGRKSRKTARL